MSLWFTLRCGLEDLGSVEILRIDPLTLKPGPDVIGTYRVELDSREVAVVRHRYGDGRWALVRTALEAMGDR